MAKRVNRFLNVLIGSVSGVFAGHCIWQYLDYRLHPDLYAIRSAPWYTSILLWGAVTAVVVLIGLIIKLLIRKKV